MKLVPATMDDARFLHALRNDPLTRANSRTTIEVPWERHLTWLAAVLIDPARRLYIAHEGAERVGSGRLDRTQDDAELSITIAPEHRRKGFARNLVAALVEHTNDDERLRAEISADNLPSLFAFMREGFLVQSTRRESDRTWVWLTREK